MPIGKGFLDCLTTMQADGSALSGSTTPTSILKADCKPTVFPQQFPAIGSAFLVFAHGRVSTAASTPGNLTLDLRFGSTVIATSTAMALATSQTNIAWSTHLLLIARVIGTAANFMHNGPIQSAALSTTPTHWQTSAPAVGSNVDLTTSQAVDLFATFSSNSASNSITCHGFAIVQLT
jgi:hypothetical protein